MKAVIEGAHTAIEEAGSLDSLKTPTKGLKEGLDAISRLKEQITRMEEDTLPIGAELQGIRRMNTSIS